MPTTTQRTTRNPYHSANSDFDTEMNDAIAYARGKRYDYSTRLPKKVFIELAPSLGLITLEDLRNLHRQIKSIVSIHNSINREPGKFNLTIYSELLQKELKKTYPTFNENLYNLILILLNFRIDISKSKLDEFEQNRITSELRLDIESLSHYKCYIEAFYATNQNPTEQERVQAFQDYLTPLLTQQLRSFYNDTTQDPYRLMTYRVEQRSDDDLVIQDLHTITDKTISCINLSWWNKQPSKEVLAQIPLHINKILLPQLTLTDTISEAMHFQWLPPHIKTISFPKILGHRRTSSLTRFLSLLPFTLNEVINTDVYRIFELNKSHPKFPESYARAFHSEDNTPITNMKNLLLHYLGTDTQSQIDGPIRTWMRTNWRDHREDVDGIIQRIQKNEFQEPIELLNALKEIALDANPNGGLKRRIDYLSNYLATHPEEAQVLQAVGPSCSSH